MPFRPFLGSDLPSGQEGSEKPLERELGLSLACWISDPFPTPPGPALCLMVRGDGGRPLEITPASSLPTGSRRKPWQEPGGRQELILPSCLSASGSILFVSAPWVPTGQPSGALQVALTRPALWVVALPAAVRYPVISGASSHPSSILSAELPCLLWPQ